MSAKNGKLLTCDRCGVQTFRKYTGTCVADGGYSRWDTFEPVEGWEYIKDVGDVCPECWKDYTCILDNFKKPPAKTKEG